MSDLIRCLVTGQPYVCPVSADASAWWMSLPCCIENLVHAARCPTPQTLPERRVQLPVISATVREVISAVELATGRRAQVRFEPDAQIETLFGRMPALDTPRARGQGFVDNASLAQLVSQATALDVTG